MQDNTIKMTNILERINKAGVRLLKPLTPEETYATIVQEGMKLVKADYGSIFLLRNDELQRVYTSNEHLNQIKVRKYGFTYRVFRKKQSIIVDVRKTKRIHPEIKNMGIKSDMMVPLSYRNKAIGVLTVQCSHDDCFKENHLEVLKLFSSIASLALRKTELYVETTKALETRDLFISMASHELKTPLTTINGYVQLLYNKLSKGVTQESKWIKELSWETYRLTQLVEELLEINRMKTGKLQYSLRECHLEEIVNRAILTFKFNHPDHNVIFENKVTAVKDLIVADFDKLIQVITNLLDNAAKFSPAGNNIIVNLQFRRPLFSISVKDTGKGIKKEDLPRIFDLFYKGSDGQITGMGLGLFLAKNVIESHHGFIDIHSEISKGTEVVIKLPTIQHE